MDLLDLELVDLVPGKKADDLGCMIFRFVASIRWGMSMPQLEIIPSSLFSDSSFLPASFVLVHPVSILRAH